MSKANNEHPQELRPFFFHRLELDYKEESDAKGNCPFCGKEQLFFVSQKTGQYHCKTCGTKGNVYTFIRKLWGESKANPAELAEVALDRRVSVATLERWGLKQSIIDREWILPGYGPKGDKPQAEIANLYRWSRMKQKDGTYKRRLLSTSNLNACMFGMQFYDVHKPDMYLCEGPWDAMALEEQLGKYRQANGKLIRTSSVEGSMLSHSCVLAVPGCETFKEGWEKFFIHKNVFILFDNDYPKVNKITSKLVPPAGYTGLQNTAKKIRALANSVKVLLWGDEGYDQEFADGYDVRDFLGAVGQ